MKKKIITTLIILAILVTAYLLAYRKHLERSCLGDKYPGTDREMCFTYGYIYWRNHEFPGNWDLRIKIGENMELR